jgi:hypothetical protein
VAFAIDQTTTYSIEERKTGGVWRWDGSAWVVPTGTDARGGVPFRSDQNANLPTCVVRYGWPRLGDYVVTRNWVELYDAYQKLWKTKTVATFANRLDPEVAEPNLLSASGQSGGGTCVAYPDGTSDPSQADTPTCSVNPATGVPDYTLMHDEVAMTNHRFDRDGDTDAVTESPGVPYASYTIERSYGAASGTANTYGDKPGDTEIANPVTRWSRLWTSRTPVDCGTFNATIEWYCYAQIDAADHDDGDVGDGYDLWKFEPGPEPLVYRAWAQVDSASSFPDNTYHSRRIGGGPGETFLHPGPPPLPPESDPAPVDADTPGPPVIHFGGFYVSKACALIDWSGAFAYL